MDYRRFFSQVALRRDLSDLIALRNKIAVRETPVILLSWGLPNPSLFPIQDATVTLKNGEKLIIDKELMVKVLQYISTAGFPPLVQQLKQLTEDLHQPPRMCETEVVVTMGSINALSIAADMLLNPGDPIIVQEPVFTGVLTALLPYGPKIIPAVNDDEGIVPSLLRDTLVRCGDCPAKVMYVNPTGNNPTGVSMSEARLREIYDIACEYNIIILEDDPYYFINFVEDLPTSFLKLDTEGRVLRFDSFSKTVSAGIRLGYVTGPQPLIDIMTADIMSSVLHTPNFSQVIVSELLNKWGHQGYLNHVYSLREEYRKKRDVMQKAAEKHLAGLCEWKLPSGGMFFWIKVLGLKDSRRLINESAVRVGVVAMPGSCFMIRKEEPCPYIRVTYSVASPEEVNKAFYLLAEVIREEKLQSKKK
nr:kynurenine/alpha-aminoadipate aminotransferase, mitochondrial-like isoform X2 [Cherax quadricarinatus]